MTLLWVMIGSFAMFIYAGFFMFAGVFIMGGYSGGGLPRWQQKVLGHAIWFLPLLGLVSACIVIYQYFTGADSNAYWWYAIPAVGMFAYFGFLKYI